MVDIARVRQSCKAASAAYALVWTCGGQNLYLDLAGRLMAACTLSCNLHFQTGLYAAYAASKTSVNNAKPHVGFCASAAGIAMYQLMIASVSVSRACARSVACQAIFESVFMAPCCGRG